MLINAGADVDAQDRRGYTPLHIVAKSGNPEIMIMLLESGAIHDVTSCKEFFCKTPLHKARTSKIVQILLQYGANPYKRLVQKNTLPLLKFYFRLTHILQFKSDLQTKQIPL